MFNEPYWVQPIEDVARRATLADEATAGFNVIFGWVPQANGSDGKSLSLADKIVILGKERDRLEAKLTAAKPRTQSKSKSTAKGGKAKQKQSAHKGTKSSRKPKSAKRR